MTEQTGDFLTFVQFIRGQCTDAKVSIDFVCDGFERPVLWPDIEVQQVQGFHNCKDIVVNCVALAVLKKCLRGKGPNIRVIDWKIERAT